MNYKIVYLHDVVKRDIPNLPNRLKKTIKKAIEERLMVDPVAFGKPLRYSLSGHRRLRVSDYRILFRIEAESKTVVTIAIKHRKEIYEN